MARWSNGLNWDKVSPQDPECASNMLTDSAGFAGKAERFVMLLARKKTREPWRPTCDRRPENNWSSESREAGMVRLQG